MTTPLSPDPVAASGSDLRATVASAGPRRPYEAPIIESGDAFERVQLASGAVDAEPPDCAPA